MGTKSSKSRDRHPPDKESLDKSVASKYSAVVFTKEIEHQPKPIPDKKSTSEDDYQDFEDDFEPYETSNGKLIQMK